MREPTGACMPETTLPDLETVRNQALLEGALDPMTLRFRIVEYDKSSGALLSTPCVDVGFTEALAIAAKLIESRRDSHFCLQPVSFVH